MFHSKRFSFTRGERCEKNDPGFHNGFLRRPNFMMSRVSGVLDVFWLLLKKSNLWFRHQKSIDMQSDWIAKHLSPNLMLHPEKIGHLETCLSYIASTCFKGCAMVKQWIWFSVFLGSCWSSLQNKGDWYSLVGGLNHCLFFHILEFHHPNWRTHSIIFQRGRSKATNQYLLFTIINH